MTMDLIGESAVKGRNAACWESVLASESCLVGFESFSEGVDSKPVRDGTGSGSDGDVESNWSSTGDSEGLNKCGSEVVIGPVPKTIQSRLYSGKFSLIFLMKSRLGWFRPERIWEMAEGWMPSKAAKSEALRFLALMIWAILSFIMSRIFFDFTFIRFYKGKYLIVTMQ